MRLYEAQLPRAAQQIIDKYELYSTKDILLVFAKLDQIKKDCQKWLDMTNNQPFSGELEALVARHLESGVDAQDIVDEMARRLNLVVDEHNLEFDIAAFVSSS